MRVYTAHIDPGSLDQDRGVVLVKEGMCWPAFFFSFLWALWHRLWGTAALLLVAVAVIDTATYLLGADDTTGFVISLGFAVFVGASANDWRRRALERRGFRSAGAVVARNAEEGIHRLFEHGADLLSPHGGYGAMGRP